MNCFRFFLLRHNNSGLINILFISVTLFFVFFLTSCDNDLKTDVYENVVIVCGDSKVLIVDRPESINDTVPRIIWQWDAQYANDLPFEYRTKKFNSIDDCKATPDKKSILVSSSSGAIAIVSIDDKRVTFFADVPNAHSIELLPDGLIAAASSTSPKGNRLMIFDINKNDELVYSDSLYSAHGVVWISNRQSLYALGYDVLREYKLLSRNEFVLHKEWKIPGISGHDLMLSPDSNYFFITEHTGAWKFDITNESFSKISNFPDAENIKSLNQFGNGRFVFTVPEQSWWTYHVTFHNPFGFLSFPNLRVYKARIIE